MVVAEKKTILISLRQAQNKAMKHFILTMLFILFLGGLSAQIGIQIDNVTYKVHETDLSTVEEAIPHLTQIFKPIAPLTQVLKTDYQKHLAFFCRVEVKLEKSTKLPIKFRLGDVQYVDWLEGKREDFEY